MTKLEKFIDKIAEIGNSKIPNDEGKVYYSKVDGSYLTRVGLKEELKFLMDKGITDQIQNYDNVKGNSANIGFNPEEQKWYGWSHRAIFGFGVGSRCKKGDCHYVPSNKEEFIEGFKSSSPSHKSKTIITDTGVNYESTFLGYPDDKSQDKFIGAVSTQTYPFPTTWGNGEWTAKTLEDAKQMAIDFAKDIS